MPQQAADMCPYQIDAEIRSDERGFGHAYAHAAEVAIRVGSAVFGLSREPAEVTDVQGRRFVMVRTRRHPDPHWIDPTYFTTTDGVPLWDLIDAVTQPGAG